MPCCGGEVKGGGATDEGDACFVLSGLTVGLDAGLCLREGLGTFSDHASLRLAGEWAPGSNPVVTETSMPPF